MTLISHITTGSFVLASDGSLKGNDGTYASRIHSTIDDHVFIIPQKKQFHFYDFYGEPAASRQHGSYYFAFSIK